MWELMAEVSFCRFAGCRLIPLFACGPVTRGLHLHLGEEPSMTAGGAPTAPTHTSLLCRRQALTHPLLQPRRVFITVPPE